MSHIYRKKNLVYIVSPTFGDFKSLPEAITWLGTNMVDDTTLELSNDGHEIDDTVTVDLSYDLNIVGAGVNTCVIKPVTGMANKPMFILKSNCDIRHLEVDGSYLANYGDNAGEDIIQLDTDGTYHEFVDVGFYHGNVNINVTSNAEVWAFNGVCNDAIAAGIRINTTSTGTKFRTSEFDISGNAVGYDLVKATDLYLTSEVDTYDVGVGNIGIQYDGTNVTYKTLAIKGAYWNEVGTFHSGFDFTRTDGRDANVEILYNVGIEDTKPYCQLELIGNATDTTLTEDVWAKATFVNTGSNTTKWKIEDNKITYQSDHSRNCFMTIDGTVATSNQPVGLNYAIVKGGNTAVLYGIGKITIDTNNRSFNFGTNVFITNVAKDEYFELYIMNETNNNDARVVDLQWSASAI